MAAKEGMWATVNVIFAVSIEALRRACCLLFLTCLFLLFKIKFFATWPKNFVFGQVLFSLACMCLCVCVSVCVSVYGSIISKSFWPISMKLGRIMYNDYISVLFEDGRTHTSSKGVIKINIKPAFLTKSQKVLYGIT